MYLKTVAFYQLIRCLAQRLLYIAAFLIIMLGHTACASQFPTTDPGSTAPTSLSSESETSTKQTTPEVLPTKTLTISPTATPVPATNTPSKAQIPLSTPELLITAPEIQIGLRFESWSPDSTWIAYWYGERNNEAPGFIAFANIRSGEICQHEEVITQGLGYGYVLWQENGRVMVFPGLDGGPLAGTPCEKFSPAENELPPETEGKISPDGRYRVDSITEQEGGLAHITTTLIDLTTGQMITTVSWNTSLSYALSAGPRWLNNELYLIGSAIDQGVLYFSVTDGKVGNLLTELLGLEAPYANQSWSVFTQVDLGAGEYHILLESQASTPSPLLLYHSELDIVEEIPFQRAWPAERKWETFGFSQDGQWLLVGNPVGKERPPEMKGENYWLRPVDPPGSEAIQMANELALGGLSLEAQRIAFFDDLFVYLLSFPNSEYLSRWGASAYYFEPLDWSPDGSHLVVVGHPLEMESTLEALFIIKP